jgi:hypothetical protein
MVIFHSYVKLPEGIVNQQDTGFDKLDVPGGLGPTH